jgi:hypothetical protein
MSHDTRVPDALSTAIAELRQELVGWIDGELARLRERERQRPVDLMRNTARDSTAETMRPAAAPPESAADHEPRSAHSNPRDRLDALARMLDRRVKQAKGAGE